MADEAKAKGNAAFSAGKYEEAIEHFTHAVSLAPENHVLYSNRSAAYASLHKYDEALADAKKTVELKSDWAKGYSRLGAALMGLKDYDAAVTAYGDGLKQDPNNEGLKAGLADAQAAMVTDIPSFGGAGMGGGAAGENMLGQAFQGADLWTKLHADPRTRSHLQDPAFRSKVAAIQANPNMLNLYLNDPRMMEVLGVALGINIQTASSAGEAAAAMSEDAPSSAEPPSSGSRGSSSREGGNSSSSSSAAAAAAPMEEDVGEEEREARRKKEEAVKEKEAGNAAYKKKDFAMAIEHYSKAMELDPTDVAFVTNRAAVYLEMGQFAECIADCDTAVEKGREVHADYKTIAKALTRKGTALARIAKSAADYDPAIAAFNKALTEHRNPDTLKKLHDAERAKKEKEQLEYFNPELGEQEREKGNDFFKEHKYPEAVRHYTEAIRRNPKDVKAYSNRAASYIKLGALPEAKKDAEKCIEIDETFVKGYLRKGAAEYFMKEHDKAMKTYQQGLKIDPGNQELQEGIRSCVQQISRANRGDIAPEELKERQAKAMQDPEIQAILTDPVMRQVLTDFQENPKAAEQHQRNPMVMAKIQKLVAAGIVQVR